MAFRTPPRRQLYAVARCLSEKPELAEAETPAHQFACFHPIEDHAVSGV